MDLKELNHAGEHAIFGSIEVLGDIDGKGMRTIRREINSMQQQQASFTKKFENYWSDLSSDGVITPVEKASLLKEWEGITQSYTALYAQASEKQLTNTPYWIDYEDAFDALKEELFTTEKIFDNMYESTTLSDKDAFDTIFSEYYYAEKFVTLAITAGLIDKLGLRALTSLSDPGQNGDLGLYRGELYQMVDGVWTKIGTETYLGILDELPEDPLDTQYFLAGDVIVFFDGLYVNGDQLYINEQPLGIERLTEVGKLYYYNGIHWALASKSDPRYLAVLSDYMTLNNALPDIMNEAFEEVARNKIGITTYLGTSDTIPVLASVGDYFVYSGIETSDWKHGRIYVKRSTGWHKLDPDEDTASQYYMTALQDILTMEKATDGFFSNIFCNAFFANKACITQLKVKTFYLEDTGSIQSANETYVPESVGLRIDASGNIDANGNTHIGGNCVIEGNSVYRGSIESGCLQLYNVPAAVAHIDADTNKAVVTFLSDLTSIYYYQNTTYRPDQFTFNNTSYAFFRYTVEQGGTITGNTTYYTSKGTVVIGNKEKWHLWGWTYTTSVTEYTVKLKYGNDENILTEYTCNYIKTVNSRVAYDEYFTNEPHVTITPIGDLPQTGESYTGYCNFTLSIDVTMGSKTMKLIGLPNYTSSLPDYTVYVNNGYLMIK